jgi:hypothetical protein
MPKKLKTVTPPTIITPPVTLVLDSINLNKVSLPASVKLVVIIKSDTSVKNACDFIIILPILVPFGTEISFHNLSNEEVKISSALGIIDGRESIRHIEINGIRTYGLVENVGWVTFNKS